MARKFALAVILYFLLFQGSALASGQLQFAKRIAHRHYPMACGGHHITLKFRPLRGKEGGWAKWWWTGNNKHNPSAWIDCSVTIDSRRHFATSKLCGIMVHEYGHLSGLEHSSNRYDVMCRLLTKKNIPPDCKG